MTWGPMAITRCPRCDWVHYVTEPCSEVMIIDDPVPDGRELAPEMRERMVEWRREWNSRRG